MQAEHAYNLRQYENAKVLAEDAVREDPRSIPAKKLLTKILIRFGADALERDDLETAKRYFEEATNYYPADPNLDPYLDLVRREERQRDAPVRRHDDESFKVEEPRPESHRRALKPAGKETAESPAKESSPASELTVKQGASLYDAPSPFAAKVGDVGPGSRVSLIHEAGGWCEVETRDGRRGYVKSEAVK